MTPTPTPPPRGAWRSAPRTRACCVQRDTYFAGRHGRLKLREQDGAAAELIAYRRPDATEPEESAFMPGAVPATRRAARGAGRGAGHDRRRRQAAAAVAVGERADPSRRRRRGWGRLWSSRRSSARAATIATAPRRRWRGCAPSWRSRTTRWSPSAIRTCCVDGADALLRAADAAMRNAYAPYSEFKVGAAVRGRTGAIYTGANVENVAYPQGQCAEASALGRAGGRRASRRSPRWPSSPSGRSTARRAAGAGSGCRSSAPRTRRCTSAARARTPHTVSLAELLPLSFGRSELGR